MHRDELEHLLATAPAILGAVVSAGGVPEAFRCWGARVDDAVLRVFADGDCGRAMDAIDAGARMAVTLTDVFTFRSIQVKGGCLGPVGLADRADREAIRDYGDRFTANLRRLGHAESLGARIRPVTVVVVQMVVDAVFDQTPGPGAGAGVTTPIGRGMIPDLASLPGIFDGVIPPVIATVSASGEPNITHLSQIFLVDATHVAVTNQFFAKTVANIAERRDASVLVTDSHTHDTYRLSLRFERREQDGDTFDRLRRSIDAIASLMHMEHLFALRSADVYEVVACERAS